MFLCGSHTGNIAMMLKLVICILCHLEISVTVAATDRGMFFFFYKSLLPRNCCSQSKAATATHSFSSASQICRTVCEHGRFGSHTSSQTSASDDDGSFLTDKDFGKVDGQFLQAHLNLSKNSHGYRMCFPYRVLQQK